MTEASRRLVLRYNPGQFTFRHFDMTATSEELHSLAMQLNSIQEDEVHQVVMVRVLQLH